MAIRMGISITQKITIGKCTMLTLIIKYKLDNEGQQLALSLYFPITAKLRPYPKCSVEAL